MQLAQQYHQTQPAHYGGYDNRLGYQSQSFTDPRIAGQQTYAPYGNNQHYAQTVYPDAVYPSQFVPGHQQTPYPLAPNQHIPQYSANPHIQNQPLPFNHQPHSPHGSYITQTRPAMQNRPTQVKQVKQVIYEQQPLNIPQPVRNIQYIPHLNRYMDYVEERIKIPVEKYYTDYFEVEHVTDFVPREYEESVIQMVPEEIIRYRLEYVPVERKIVHMPKNQLYDENGLFKGVGNLADRKHTDDAFRGQSGQVTTGEINKALYDNLSHSQKKGLDESLVNDIVKDIELEARNENMASQVLYHGIKGQMSRNVFSNIGDSRNVNSYSNLPQNEILEQAHYRAASRQAPSQKSKGSRRRSNFVTSDGYFPNYEEEMRNMESSLNASRERYV